MPSGNLSCDYEIIFTISSRNTYYGSNVIANAFHSFFVYELSLEQ